MCNLGLCISLYKLVEYCSTSDCSHDRSDKSPYYRVIRVLNSSRNLHENKCNRTLYDKRATMGLTIICIAIYHNVYML